MFEHSIRVTLGETGLTGAGLATDQVKEFELVSDMLELADPWSMSTPLTRELWDMAPLDSTVRIWVDDSQVLEGYIDEREREGSKDGGSLLTLAGRDKGGRLLDESAPLKTFAGRTLQDLAAELVAPWFPNVTLSNATNRDLVRGRGRRLAKTSGEPAIVEDRNAARKVEPGETRASVLMFFLERAQLLGWSSANGREFIIGRPSYSQAPQFFFFAAAANSARWPEANVSAFTYRESTSERYGEIQVVGSSKGDETNYGPNVTKRTASAKSSAFGLHPKKLIVSDDDIGSPAAARARAEREMLLREATGHQLALTVPGFGQALGGDPSTPPALYACDTIARWEDEEIGLSGDYLITRVRFRRSRGGETTELSLVPRGTELVAR